MLLTKRLRCVTLQPTAFFMSVTLLKSGAIWHAFCEVHNQVDRGHFSAFPTFWFGVPWRREMICRDCVDVFSKHIDRDCIQALSSPNAIVKLQLTSFVAYAIIFVGAALLNLTKQPACQKLLSPSQIASRHHAPLSLSPPRPLRFITQPRTRYHSLLLSERQR